jgi:hypothetical protein
MSLIIPANTLASGGYAVDNSVRMDDGSTEYFSRTCGSTASSYTVSMWVKTSKSSGSSTSALWWNAATNKLNWELNDNGQIFCYTPETRTTAYYRDTSAWYHLVWKIASNTGTLYVNGAAATGLTGIGSIASLVSGNSLQIGGDNGGSTFDGYIAEACFIDGTALNPDQFGEFDEDSGIWKPIDVSGLTFGTQGFYLDFKDSSALGNDVSGNNNDLTANNLTATDQSTDTPTNNFATLNPLAQTTTKGTVSEANLEYDRAGSSDGWVSILSTIGASAGKYYAEIKIIDVGSPSQGCVLGFLNLDESNIQSSSSTYLGAATADAGMGWYSVGNVFRQGGHVNIINSYTDNDIVMLAMDLDNGFCYFGKNGSWENSGNPTSGASGTGGYATSNMTANGTYCFAVSLREAGNVQMNFGSPPFAISSGNADADGYGNFEYAVPSGYYALCTKNLGAYGG